MVKSEALDFSFVEELPKREKTRWQKVWEHWTAIRSLSEENGGLIPVKLAGDIAGVSHERIHQLMGEKILLRIEVQGHPFVAVNSFLAWAKSERKAGRPLKTPDTVGDKWRAARGKPRKEKAK